MSELRRRLMMQQFDEPKYFYYKNNSSGFARLYNRNEGTLKKFTIKIPETGETLGSGVSTYKFSDNALHPVQIDFDKEERRLSFFFSEDTDIYAFDDGVFSGLINLQQVTRMFWNNKTCQFTDAGLFVGNPNITNFDYCFAGSNIDILPQDENGYLWQRRGGTVGGIDCFADTPAATSFQDIIPYGWR